MTGIGLDNPEIWLVLVTVLAEMAAQFLSETYRPLSRPIQVLAPTLVNCARPIEGVVQKGEKESTMIALSFES